MAEGSKKLRRSTPFAIAIAAVIASLIGLILSAFTCGDDSDTVLNPDDENPYPDDDDGDDDTLPDDDEITLKKTCLIDGIRYNEMQTHPDNVCLICDVKKSQTQWTENNAAPCDDGLFCNSRDLCYYGECYLHEGDPCAPRDCDEDLDECVDSPK